MSQTDAACSPGGLTITHADLLGAGCDSAGCDSAGCDHAAAHRALDLPPRPSFRAWAPFWIPLLVLIFGSIFFRVTDADRIVTRCFYTGERNPWPLRTYRVGYNRQYSVQPYWWLTQWCSLPAWIMAVGGTTIGFFGLFLRPLRWWTVHGCFIGFALLLGPGLIINIALKDQWGRPRPDEIVDFGGECQFVPVGSPGTLDRHNSSFPSGHAAMGFFLLTPAFVLYRRHPQLAGGVLRFGITYGILIGLLRIIDGKHFASDVLWAFGLVYFTSYFLRYFSEWVEARFFPDVHADEMRCFAPLPIPIVEPATIRLPEREAIRKPAERRAA